MILAKGQGKKITKGKMTDQDALMIFVDKKKPLEDLSPDEIIPPKIDGQITDVYELGGEIELMRRKSYNPILGGISMGHPIVTAGTLGGIFDRNGEDVILTNAHVGCPHWNGAEKGDVVIQPGRVDGGKREIGEVLDFQEIKFGEINYIDASIIKPSAPYSKEILEIPEINWNIKRVKAGDVVKKSGRTTGLTVGRVIASNVQATVWFKVGNEKKLTTWNDQVFVAQENYEFINGGDSGSLVLTENNEPCGLVYAAAPNVGIFNNFDRVAKRFNLMSANEYGWVASEFTVPRIIETTARLNYRQSPMGQLIETLPMGQKLEVVDDVVVNQSGYLWRKVKKI